MKKALLATLIGTAFAGSAYAADYDFSYADGEVGFYGYQKKETYDIAIFLPGSTFEGMKVKSVSVPVYAVKGISGYKNPTVWLSSELLLEKKKNAPNIASYEANLELTSEDIATLSFTLPEDGIYTVTSEGVYVGYSFEVEKNDGGTKYPMALTAGGASGSFFLHTSTSVKSWTDQAESDHRSSAMVVGIEADNLSTQNVSVESMPSFVNLSLNEPASVEVKLSSTASEPVTSVDFEYTFAGKGESYHYDLPDPVEAGIGKLFSAILEIAAQSELGSETVDVKVTKVNGQPNTSNNATGSLKISVFELAPIHLALFEEYTCTKCGYCVRGYAALEYLKINYPEFVCVSYHNNGQGNDPMTVGNPPVSVSGNPSSSLDRSLIGIDPYYGTQTYSTNPPILGDILAINEQQTPWGIRVSHTWDDDNTLTANVEVVNVEGYEKGSYKIGYLLVADGLSGEDSSWSQSNYYSSNPPQFIPEMNNFCVGGIYGMSSVPGLVFNDVVISTSGYKGVNDSMPSDMEALSVVNHSNTWDLTTIKSHLIQDKNKLRIVAFVLDGKGKVLNSAKQDVTDYTGASVEGVGVDDNAPVEFYNLNGMKVSNPQGGIFIRRQGNTTEKVVIK